LAQPLQLLYAPNWLFLLPGSLLIVGLGLVFWLFPGPRHLGRHPDVHHVFGMMFAKLGAQVIPGLFAKVFSYAERFSHNQRSLERWLRRVKLEDGLVMGGTLACSGAEVHSGLWKWQPATLAPSSDRAVILSPVVFLECR
jgi:hypothetical protein